ncbi:hypothetical protein [Polluticaenibacter yanchengensis]|uniref:Lipoprotein n=1 Tax=Polluticaenibacter yanchengensis TaxID=3014562 RepID=A0ABT4UFF1_9BACT|nr:hypothetical protein [Chitinophagaceae bacterium LY-5]
MANKYNNALFCILSLILLLSCTSKFDSDTVIISNEFIKIDTVNSWSKKYYDRSTSFLKYLRANNFLKEENDSFYIRILYVHSLGYYGNFLSISSDDKNNLKCKLIDFVRDPGENDTLLIKDIVERMAMPNSGWMKFIEKVNEIRVLQSFSKAYPVIEPGADGDNIDVYIKHGNNLAYINFIDLMEYNGSDSFLLGFKKLMALLLSEFEFKLADSSILLHNW